MKLHNTLTRQIETLTPLNPPNVALYTCGPTVYDYTHIGHLRKFTYDDILKRTLTYMGYNVKHVMNITDVGHLTGDTDEGEDKLEKGAKKTGKTVWEVAQFYTDQFVSSIKKMNIIDPLVLCKATDHVKDMIHLIQKLEQKGFTYDTPEAVYFDTQKFPDYGKLSRQSIEEKKQAVRDNVHLDPNKKHPADFALWFKRVGRFKDHSMRWNSPWGDGFPGWHIECSAMAMKYLGESIDIHTGGIDHIPVHHENEIAQSEAATGKPFSQFWVHHNFLNVEGEKMSKSLGNFYTLNDVEKKGIEPMALRLLYLQAHYRQLSNFTWEAVKSAQEAYDKLKEFVITLRSQTSRTMLSEEKLQKVDEYRNRFRESVASDLQLPQGVAIMWEMLKSSIPSGDKLDLLFEFDQVLGLRLTEVEEVNIPEEIQKLAEKRFEAKKAGNYEEGDKLRKEIESKGYAILDSANSYVVKKK
ncbi:MAG: cysteine--tRNA ligase [bacterium]|nr:cysteine--tRNA ligase [bacterium]